VAVLEVLVTEDGLRLPEHVLTQLDLRPGDRARLEIHRLPDAQTVRNIGKRMPGTSSVTLSG
jgi:hypothetical protein